MYYFLIKLTFNGDDQGTVNGVPWNLPNKVSKVPGLPIALIV